jgi:hypothetical protein
VKKARRAFDQSISLRSGLDEASAEIELAFFIGAGLEMMVARPSGVT